MNGEWLDDLGNPATVIVEGWGPSPELPADSDPMSCVINFDSKSFENVALNVKFPVMCSGCVFFPGAGTTNSPNPTTSLVMTETTFSQPTTATEEFSSSTTEGPEPVCVNAETDTTEGEWIYTGEDTCAK